MATCLAMLPNLEHLRFGFEFSRILPNRTNPPLPIRTVLPTLTSFRFEGVSEYLDDFVARIDAPALQTFYIDIRTSVFHIPQLYRFISHAERPKLPTRAMVNFDVFTYIRPILSDGFELTIRCGRGVPWMASVCQELSPFLCHVERLELHGQYRLRDLPHHMHMEPPQWPELFHPFIAVQSLYVSTQLVQLIVPALQDLTGARAIEVLPELRMLVLEEGRISRSVEKVIESFVATCQRSNHPVVVQRWSIDDDHRSL